MEEYETLGHMLKVDVQPIFLITSCQNLLARQQNTSVVFNTSAKDLSSTTLNDYLMVGPQLQPELFDTLIRFRKYPVAFCCDIEKMYQQIIRPEKRKY